VAITRSSSLTGAEATFSIAFETETPMTNVNGTYIYFKVPTNFLYSSGAIACTLDGAPVAGLCEIDSTASDWGIID